MNRHEFYDNLNKFKALQHSTNLQYYNKIDKYYPDGSARYFYSKAEWDAYVEGKNRTAYEEANKAKKSSGSAANTAAIEADARNKYEASKKIANKEDMKAELANTEEKKKQEEEKIKKQIEKKENELTFQFRDMKKDYDKGKVLYQANKAKGNTHDPIVGMIDGQEEKTVADLIKELGGNPSNEKIATELANKAQEFKSKMNEIKPQLEDFVIGYIGKLSGASLEEILNDKDKLVEDIYNEFKKEYNQLAKYIADEYTKIYGMVEDGNYLGIIYEIIDQIIKGSKKVKDQFTTIKNDIQAGIDAYNEYKKKEQNAEIPKIPLVDKETSDGLLVEATRWVADKIMWLFS